MVGRLIVHREPDLVATGPRRRRTVLCFLNGASKHVYYASLLFVFIEEYRVSHY